MVLGVSAAGLVVSVDEGGAGVAAVSAIFFVRSGEPTSSSGVSWLPWTAMVVVLLKEAEWRCWWESLWFDWRFCYGRETRTADEIWVVLGLIGRARSSHRG